MYVSNADNSAILDAIPPPYPASLYQYTTVPAPSAGGTPSLLGVALNDATTTAPKIFVFNMPLRSTSTPVATLTTSFSRPNGTAIAP